MGNDWPRQTEVGKRLSTMGAEQVRRLIFRASRRLSLRGTLQGEPGVGFQREGHLTPKERAGRIDVALLGGGR